jgi:predicted ATPase
MESDLNFKVKVKNFGPILSGDIEIKPFTIFVGPNNSGKSYTSMLIRSLIESISFSPLSKREPLFFGLRPFYDLFTVANFFNKYSELRDKIIKLKWDEEITLPKDFIKEVFDLFYKTIFEKRFNEKLSNSFSCHIQELVRSGKNNFSVDLDFNSTKIKLKGSKEKIKFREIPEYSYDILVKSKRNYNIRRSEQIENSFCISIPQLSISNNSELQHIQVTQIIGDSLANFFISNIIEKFNYYCYYLPAARSGLLEAYRSIAAAAVKRFSMAGIEEIDIPSLSGTITDFLSTIIEMPQIKGPFFDLAVKMEKEIIDGEIILKKSNEYSIFEIQYKTGNLNIPLHRSSSTILEIAPLILYLKHIVRKKGIIIIEEPEAHLHPYNQMILAKYLVKLRREGLNIIITTHSDYLLEQLSNFVLLKKLSPEKRKSKYNHDENDYLRSDEVSMYTFNKDNNQDGYKISRVSVNEDEGISLDEYTKIIDILYDETFSIRKDLNSIKQK